MGVEEVGRRDNLSVFTQADLELVILLPQPLWWWNYKIHHTNWLSGVVHFVCLFVCM